MDKSSENLTIYLERVLAFLTSNDNSIIFQPVSMSIEDILVKIAKDTNFLKQSEFGDDCKGVAAKLSTVLDKSKGVFTLNYEFKFDDKRKKVIVYKKKPVPAYQGPVKVPSKPLRIPNVIQKKTEDNNPVSVMSSFKILFLNATLKFVKDDSQMILSYPNMSTEQANFVKQTIDQCMESDGTKAGFKGLYDPLTEALKIFSLKFDFKLYVGTKGDMRKLTFVKRRKNADTIKMEGTKVIYEETTDSDSSLEQSRKQKPQKKLITLIDVITQLTPEFKLRALTDLKDFLKDNTSFHTFLNLSSHEQQFISQWQALTKRVEVMKMFDLQCQMVLDEIRGYVKRKNFRIKVELGMTSSRGRFAVLRKVLKNPNNVKLSEEKVAKLEAVVSAAREAEHSSSGNSSSESTAKPRNKFERNVAMFFRKTKGVKNDWIKATLTQLRKFLQDENEASLIIRSLTEPQTAFLSKWQTLLSEPEVIKTYPTDVQLLLNDVRDAARVNKKKFRVEFSTAIRNGLGDAKFAKIPAFYTPPSKIPKENVPVNNLPKNNGNKTENDLDIDANVNKTSNVLVNIPFINKENTTENNLSVLMENMSIKNDDKTEKSKEKAAMPTNINLEVIFEPCDDSNKGVLPEQKATAPKSNLTAPVKLVPKNEGNKDEKCAEKAAVPTNVNLEGIFEPCDHSNKVVLAKQKATAPKSNLAAPVKLVPKIEGNKDEKSPEKTAVPTNVNLEVIFEPCHHSNKGVLAEQKATEPKSNWTAPVKLEPKNEGNKGEKSAEKAAVPTNINLEVIFEPCDADNKGVLAKQKATAPKSNLTAPVKLEPKNEGNKDEKSSEDAAVRQTTKYSPPENYEAKEISKKVEIFVERPKAAPKKKNYSAPVKFEPKMSDDKVAITPTNAMEREANNLQSGSVADLYRTVCMELKAAEEQSKKVSPKAVHKSTSLTSLDQTGRAKNAGKVVKLPAATVKLIEGLNQPLVSERGLKMMRQMGWQGGPLGVRGEGIAEPIMPAIELEKRAGLGAPKPNIKVLVASKAGDDGSRKGIVQPPVSDLKNDLMQTLLRMVKGEEPQRTVKFHHKLSMKDWNYITAVASAFNNRDTSHQGMSAVLQYVTDIELMLSAALSCSKTEILLILSKYNEEIKLNRNQWSHVTCANETLSKKSRKKLLEVAAAEDIDRAMVTGKAFKQYVMAKILDFCLNCNAESPAITEVSKDIVLKGTMADKQISFITDVVRRVNASAPCSSNSSQAIAIHDEIVSAIQGKGYKMSVDFPTDEKKDGEPLHNIITLTKTYGYRIKTVLIKLPTAKTQTTTNNNCTTNENKNLITTQNTKKTKKNHIKTDEIKI